MTKSPIQIASELVSDCPGTFNMTYGERQLLIGIIAEELKKQRKEGYEAARKGGELRIASMSGNKIVVTEIIDK